MEGEPEEWRAQAELEIKTNQMFLEFFQLREDPFGVTPDPAYLFPSRTHTAALKSLREGILRGRGFLTLIAEPGMGKTTLLYQLIEQLPPETRIAFLFQTQCNSREFFQYLLSELGVDPEGMGLVAMHNKLNGMLFDEMLQGRRFVLIVDEAQNLDYPVLETVRLLSNFETSHSKLIQIVLAGQPELATKLKQRQLAQLLQRITVTSNLEAFSLEETAGYIRHRLRAAGHAGEDLFDARAVAAVYERSQGIPRNINRICHAALSLAGDEQLRSVTAATVARADRPVDFAVNAPREPQSAAASRFSTGSPSQTPQPVPVNFVPLTGSPPAAPAEHKPSAVVRSYRRPLWAGAFAIALLAITLAIPSDVRDRFLGKLHASMLGSKSVARGSDVNDPVAASDTPVKANSIDRASPVPEIGKPGAPLATSGIAVRKVRIVIDPGHGGTDIGSKGPHGLLEKNVSLEIALRLGEMIEEGLPGAEVIYTRNEDGNFSAQERTAIANSAHADLLISIHANSPGGTEGKGSGTYYSSTAQQGVTGTGKSAGNEAEIDESSKALALAIQNTLAQELPQKSAAEAKRVPGQGPFVVLTGARMPAVLSEVPFVDASGNENLLLDGEQRQKVAQGLFRGIVAYLNSIPPSARKTKKPVSENRLSTLSEAPSPSVLASLHSH